ncbi:MAG: recombinase family protein, partial [Rhodospirillales bacterium]|nr:recombinase family protein [Rhodospirillales bacterium]
MTSDDRLGQKTAVIYVRVSTPEQAANDLSLVTQEEQLVARCSREGWKLVATYRDEGESGTSTKRPGFEAMVERLTDGSRSVDYVLVYSLSRAFRNALDQEMTIQSLRRHKVEIVSQVEAFGADATGKILRQFVGIVNEYQSHEISRNTTRTMKENARRGYSNGGIIPFGYKSVDAEILGNKQKKRLAIEPVEAEVVRACFRLAVDGDGTSGPLGTKKIAMWLNERGFRSRGGKLFGTGTIHEILTRVSYTGKREFNAIDRETGERKKAEEIVTYEVPQIIDNATFASVQALLVSRQPTKRGPRLDSAPSLLGGLIRCDCAPSHALTAATGTSRNGALYTYYKCIQSTKQGRHCTGNGAACCNRRIPRPTADKLVTEAVVDKLLTPERVMEILASVKQRQDERQASANRRMADLAREAADSELRLNRLYKAIEDGVVDSSDPTLQGARRRAARARELAAEALEYARRSATDLSAIDPVAVETFARLARERLLNGEIAARKAYIGAVIDAVI